MQIDPHRQDASVVRCGPEWQCARADRSGLEENRVRARTEAKRLKSSLFERSEFEDFSGADGLASDFLHRGPLRVIPRGRDLFRPFLYPDKNGRQTTEGSEAFLTLLSALDRESVASRGYSHDPTLSGGLRDEHPLLERGGLSCL